MYRSGDTFHLATVHTIALRDRDPLAHRQAPANDGLALFRTKPITNHRVERGEHGAAVALYRRAGKDDPATGKRQVRIDLASSELPVSLRFQLDGARLDVYYAVEPEQWTPVASGLDASLLSADIAGGFIGSTFGPYALPPVSDTSDRNQTRSGLSGTRDKQFRPRGMNRLALGTSKTCVHPTLAAYRKKVPVAVAVNC